MRATYFSEIKEEAYKLARQLAGGTNFAMSAKKLSQSNSTKKDGDIVEFTNRLNIKDIW